MLNLTANGSYSAALYIILPAVIYWLFSILHPLTAQSQSPLSKAPEMALPAARISAKKSPTAAIIFMHGLGDRGTGWQFLADEAARRNVLEHVNFVFPDAPLRPITLNFGMQMPAWYDIPQLEKVRTNQDEAGILESVNLLKQYIAEQKENGIPTNRIIIGGFSQGYAVSVSTFLTLDFKVGGFCGLSGYVPIQETLKTLQTGVNKNTPAFHGHGTADNVIKFTEGHESARLLKSEFGLSKLEWHAYDGLVHSVSPTELDDLFSWFQNVIGEE